MPKVIDQDGFRVYVLFPPREHGPAHVHVENSDGEVVITLPIDDQDLGLREVTGMRPKDVIRAVRLIEPISTYLLRAGRKSMAKRPTISNNGILAQLPAAERRAERARSHGLRATAVTYDAAKRRIMLELSNGHVFGFPVAVVDALSNVPADSLGNVELSPSGSMLHWNDYDVDLDVPGLIVSSLGHEERLRQFARAAGSITSEKKAAAARANGQKGGRPKRANLVAATLKLERASTAGATPTRAGGIPTRASDSSNRGQAVHVVPAAGGKYVMKVSGKGQPQSKPSTKSEAVAIAKKLARKRNSEIVIHGRDGSIRERSSSAADAARPRSRKYHLADPPLFDLCGCHIANAVTDSRSSEMRGLRPRSYLARLQLS